MIVNARSGTIVIGAEVMVKTAAVAGNEPVDESRSQPARAMRPSRPDRGYHQSEVGVEEEDVRMFLLQDGVSLQEIVAAVNRVGAAPGTSLPYSKRCNRQVRSARS